MTPKQQVLQRYPKANCYFYGSMFRVRTGTNSNVMLSMEHAAHAAWRAAAKAVAQEKQP